MNAHQLDANGVILNTIVVDSLDVLPNLVDATIGGTIGDRVVAGVVSPKPPALTPVPFSVTRRQARQALLINGLIDNVEPLIAAIPDELQRRLAMIEWQDSQEFERNRPLLQLIGSALGLDSAGLDSLFIQAAAL